jgi:hypothetical protein
VIRQCFMCVVRWANTPYPFRAWNILMQWCNTSVIHLKWMCFVLFPLAKSTDNFSLLRQLLPVLTTWTCCNNYRKADRTSLTNKAEPCHTSIQMSVLTSVLIFPVVGLGTLLMTLVCTCPLWHVIYDSCHKGSWSELLLSIVRCWNICGKNWIDVCHIINSGHIQHL